MAGRDNLRKLTTEEAREIGAKGGKASVKSRRKRKTIRECLEMLLAKDVTDDEAREMLAGMGIAETDMQNPMLIAVGLFRKAADGDVQAVKTLLEAMGESKETPGGNVVVNIIDDLK